MNIGIVCYASVGGSGIVATELAKCLAARGHDVHMISTDTPFRYSEYQPGLSFHRVNTPAYPQSASVGSAGLWAGPSAADFQEPAEPGAGVATATIAVAGGAVLAGS